MLERSYGPDEDDRRRTVDVNNGRRCLLFFQEGVQVIVEMVDGLINPVAA